MIAPVQRTFMIGLPHCGECCRAGRRLAVRSGHAGIVEIAADQAQVHIPARGDRSARLIRAAKKSGSHGEMMPMVSSRSRQVRSDRPVVAD